MLIQISHEISTRPLSKAKLSEIIVYLNVIENLYSRKVNIKRKHNCLYIDKVFKKNTIDKNSVCIL